MNRISYLRYSVFILFALFALVFGMSCTQNPNISEEAHSQITISEGWMYRWGDSPADESNIPIWTYLELNSPEWNATQLPIILKNPTKAQIIWLRVPIPEGNWAEPTLYLPRVISNLEVWLNNTKIYSFGEMRNIYANRFNAFVPHLIRLPDNFYGKVLFFRIYSSLPHLKGIQGAVLLDSGKSLLLYIIKKDAPQVLVGFFCIFFGLFSLAALLDRTVGRTSATVSFGFFLVFVGFGFLGMSTPLSLILHAPQFWYYALFLSFFLFPPALIAFVDQVIGPGYKHFIRRLWQVHLGIAAVGVLLELLKILPMAFWMRYLQILWAFDNVLILGICVYASFKGRYEAKLFTLGLAFFASGALFDLLSGPEELLLMPIGTFLFIITLGYIMYHRYTENSRRLSIYSKELEENSKRLEEAKSQLEEYSRTLEEKVDVRTREVREKQAQLVQSSKMASLGSLVAGVAHEINTPVGAINSMHNTLMRAVDKLKGEIEDTLRQNKLETEKFAGSIAAIDEANEVIRSGTERVIDIVRRLRSFARLDEAELKNASIHEGLEDTLTIIHHQIKHDIKIVKNYGDIPYISCYPGRLNQVFLNLLINAKQAIKDKGEITLTTYVKNNRVHIEIKDNGQGISPVNLPKIFDPGFTTKGVGIGTGLGLSICYQIIQDHRGEIKAESQVGQGTTFTISLPMDLETILDNEKKQS